MGHYASEMQCDECGRLRCKCPSLPEKPNNNFIVADDYQVMTVDEFDKQTSGVTSLNPLIYRIGKPEFKKRSEAETYAEHLCKAAVEKAHEHFLRTRNVLDVQRPWKKK